MWHLLEKFSEQVNTYGTVCGKLWYLCVFLYRLIVIATIGGAVYGDEQSAFKCTEVTIGCTNACFNQFSMISHMRFWAFQLLVVVTPAILFHFYSTKVTGDIEKLKKAEEDFQTDDSAENNAYKDEESLQKLWRRRQTIGVVKVKQVYTSGGNLKDIPFTPKLRFAYMINVLVRLALEAVSLYVSFVLFQFPERRDTPLGYMILRVPTNYRCYHDDETVDACYGTFLGNTQATVSCWVSRPWEKTIFMSYMNLLSALCCILSFLELVYLLFRELRDLGGRRSKRNAKRWNSRVSDMSIKSECVLLRDATGAIPAWSPVSIRDNGICRGKQKMSRV